MSAVGDALGTAINTAQAAVRAAFLAAHPAGRKPPPSTADFSALSLALDQAKGNAIEASTGVDIQQALSQIGTGEVTMQIVAAVDIRAGQPVYVDLVSGQLKLASAASFAASLVLSLVQVSTLAGYAAPLATSMLELTDWTAVVGSTTLQRGQEYFLSSTPGQLTLVAPTIRGQALVSVGEAANFTQFKILPSTPILL